MASTSGQSSTGGQLARRILYLALVTGLGLFVIYAATRAIQAAFVNDDFPEALAVKLELLPWLFPVHMIAGGAALLLVPLAILLRHQPARHRIAGRIAATSVAVAGVTAFPVALLAPVTTWSAAGFAAQGTVWLVLLVAGVIAIRRRQVMRHRACMLLMAATTSGALFFRIYLALWALYGSQRHYEAFYAADAWLAWTIPLGFTALMLKRTGAKRRDPR